MRGDLFTFRQILLHGTHKNSGDFTWRCFRLRQRQGNPFLFFRLFFLFFLTFLWLSSDRFVLLLSISLEMADDPDADDCCGWCKACCSIMARMPFGSSFWCSGCGGCGRYGIWFRDPWFRGRYVIGTFPGPLSSLQQTKSILAIWEGLDQLALVIDEFSRSQFADQPLQGMNVKFRIKKLKFSGIIQNWYLC